MTVDDIDNFADEVKKTIADWFVGSGFTVRKLTDTPTDDLQVVNKKYVDNNTPVIPAAEWTYDGKLTFSNSSTQQNYTPATFHDWFKVIFKVNNAGAANNIFIQMGLNNVGGTAYSFVQHTNTAINLASGSSSWNIYDANAGGQSDIFMGEVLVTGTHTNGFKAMVEQGSGAAGTNAKIPINGYLSGDSQNIVNLNIIPANAITGTVEFWYKDSK